MECPSTRTIERRLLSLDHEGFVGFVAELWAASGWDVARDDRELVVSRQGESKRLLVLSPYRTVPRLRRAPEHTEPIDAVVSPYAGTDLADLPRGMPKAPIVDAERIRERLCYAIEEEPRDRLLETLGAGTGGGRVVHGPGSVAPLRVPRPTRTSAASVGLLLVLLGVATLLVATGVPFGDAASGTANASEPQSAGGFATASAAVYDAYPNCERGPREIVEISSNATRGSSLSRGLVVMGDFWNPNYVEASPHGTWYEFMRSDAHLEYYGAESVTLGEPRIDGEEATVIATATIDGEERQYVYELGRGDRPMGEGCWMLERFARA